MIKGYLGKDYRYNDEQHIDNFLKYMFITNQSNCNKHAGTGQLILGPDVSSQLDWVYLENMVDKRQFLKLLKSKYEINVKNFKSVVLEFEFDDEDVDSVVDVFNKYIEPDLKEACFEVYADCYNIKTFVVASHYEQTNRLLHYHIIYISDTDVPDQFPRLLSKRLYTKHQKKWNLYIPDWG